MKRIKKAVSVVLALTLFASFASITALAVEEYTINEIVPVSKYDPYSLYSFSEGLATVESNGKYGFINESGQEVIPCQYTYADAFSEGLAAVELDGKWGFIDQTGKIVIPLEFSYANSFTEGLAAVTAFDSDGWGYINKTGELVIPYQYDWAYWFYDGVAVVQTDTGDFEAPSVYRYTYSYIDKTGRSLTKQYNELGDDFSEGFAVVGLNGKYGYIDTTGKEVIPLQYEAAAPFSEGLAAVMSNGKWGFIDTTGKLVIPMKYSSIENFSEGFAAVEFNEKWGYIDKTGKEITPFQFDYIDAYEPIDIKVYSFQDGHACVNLNGEFGYIDTDGEIVIPSTLVSGWDNHFSNGRFVYAETENGKKGVMDISGKQIVPCKYDAIWFSDDLIMVELGGRRGVISVAASDSDYSNIANTAYPSTQAICVDSKDVTFECYALKDKNGNDTNYIKLRDLAFTLNGSDAQFQVGWNGNVTITTGTAYTPNGSENNTPFSGKRLYEKVSAQTIVDGQAVDIAAFQLKDDQGGGYTYYQLRDIGKALGFNVGWSSQSGIFIDTKTPYDPSN